MMLGKLPPEIWEQIAKHLDRDSQINALCRTNRAFHSLLVNYLYQHNAYGQLDRKVNQERKSVDDSNHDLEPPPPQIVKGVGKYHAIRWAMRLNRVATLKRVMEAGINIHSRICNWHDPPIFEATFFCNAELVRFLLENGGDVNVLDCRGESLLHRSATHRTTNVAQVLVEFGVNVNLQDKYGKTALYKACEIGGFWSKHHVRSAGSNMVDFLLDNDADFTIAGPQGTPLQRAAAMGNRAAVAVLLRKEAERAATTTGTGRPEDTPLLAAIRDRAENMAVMFIEEGGDVEAANLAGETPLFLAIETNCVHVLDLLLQQGVDPNKENEQGKLPILEAVNSRNIEAMRVLHRNGADLENLGSNWDGCTALYVAIKEGFEEGVQFLLEIGANVDSKG